MGHYVRYGGGEYEYVETNPAELRRQVRVVILVEHNAGDGRLVCLGFMARSLARRIVARGEWRSRAA